MVTAGLWEQFARPPNDFRPMPLLRINDEVDEAELRRQIRSLREQGFGGVFSLCECFEEGAPAKFVSPWWWRVVKCVARACAEEGIQFWAYDDEDWPSGSVGGTLTQLHPEHQWKYLRPLEHHVAGGERLELDLGRERVLCASAWRERDGKPLDPAPRSLGPAVDCTRLVWEAPAGDRWNVTVYVAREGRGFSLDGLADLMDEQACAQFVRDVYTEHAARVAATPGARIVGFFTDEPCLSMATMPWGGRFDWYPAMPWTPSLAGEFERQHGYDWAENLPHLYHEFGPESLRFRCHHWDTCSRLFARSYFGQIYRFCDEHGLLSSGHLMREEEFANLLALQGGNSLRLYRQMHVPGVDWIHPLDAYPHLTSVTFKCATSVAHAQGRPRVWCESFAAIGWGATFQQMRRIVNWEHVNGISMQVPITWKYSLRGPKRTRFYPPGISWQQPYWEHFRAFADCEARLCALAAGGGHVAQLALLYPTADLWSHCWDRDLLEKRGNDYNALADLVRSHGYDYDIVDDDALAGDAVVEGGTLRLGPETFVAFIVPAVDAVSLAALRRAAELAHSGGSLLFTCRLPRHTMKGGADDPQLAALLHGLFGAGDGKAAAREPGWHPCGTGQVALARDGEGAVALLRERIVPELQADDGAATAGDRGGGALRDVYAYRRQLHDGDLYLLFSDAEAARELVVTVRARGCPEVWNPQTGKRERVGVWHVHGAGTSMRLAFPPFGMLPVLVRPVEAVSSAAEQPPAYRLKGTIAVDGPSRFRAQSVIDRPEAAWNFTQHADGWTSTSPAPPQVPETMPVGDWCDHSLDTFSGLGTYAGEVELPPWRPGARIELELGRVGVSARVWLNGVGAGLTCFEPHRLDVTRCARPGVNALEIEEANTLANYYLQFAELAGKPLAQGGDLPERRRSGLLGPVRVPIWVPDDA